MASSFSWQCIAFIFLFVCILNYRVFYSWLSLCKVEENIHLADKEVRDNVFKPNSESDQACIIPELQLYNEVVNETISKSPTYRSCEDQGNYPLLFNSTLDGKMVPVKSLDEFNEIEIGSCCYRVITRGNVDPIDTSYSIDPKCHPVSLENITTIPTGHEFIVISCRKQNSEIVFDFDMHSFVHHPNPEFKSTGNITANDKKSDNINRTHGKVNVIVFGLDATSRMNFIRMMPKSFAYLIETLKAVEMRGYNKVDDNTFPNISPMLTSLSVEEIGSGCGASKQYDTCPFVWKQFKKEDYITSFAEDASGMAIFNYQREGFQKAPTDYYFRPFSVAADTFVSSQQICHGPRLTFQVLLDNSKKFVYQMNKAHQPFFQFTWATALTHDYLNVAEMGDIHLLNALQWMNSGGYLENTALIIMSDHGLRVGDFRNTFQGQLEDRLPFMILQLPEWMRRKYARAYHNLEENVDRLTTTYDLHQTLIDILHLENLEDEVILKKESKLTKLEMDLKLPRGISLFHPIPKGRTCDMAAIKPNFCSCNSLRPTSIDDKSVKEAAAAAVIDINSILKPFQKCSVLSLSSVTMAQEGRKSNQNFYTYLVNFKTKPGEASFEALVSRNKENGNLDVMGTISRTNLYGNQSHCVHDSVIKLFCFCNDAPTY